jgi:hypothetical protein
MILLLTMLHTYIYKQHTKIPVHIYNIYMALLAAELTKTGTTCGT